MEWSRGRRVKYSLWSGSTWLGGNKNYQLFFRGTPCQYANIIILDLFKLTFLDCNLAYNASLQNLFKNKSTE